MQQMKWKRCGSVGTNSRLHDEVLFGEILSRLPVKSLARFKCVSKRWQSTIQKDDLFIDLHFSRSKATGTCSFRQFQNQDCTTDHRMKSSSMELLSMDLLIPSDHKDELFADTQRRRLKSKTTLSRALLLIGKRSLVTAELLLTSDDKDGRGVALGASSLWMPPSISLIEHDHELPVCTLDGLICFIDTRNYRACVCNVSTRESTPWIKSAIKQEVDEDKRYEPRMIRLGLMKHAFGYDPVTKEHKVVALWCLRRFNSVNYVPVIEVLCEVLTVRQNSWRKIDVGLHDKSPYEVVTSVYTSGSIYWQCKRSAGSYLIEFDVGSEKFRLVDSPPRLISTDDCFYMSNFMELDGGLARLLGTRKGACETNLCLLRHNENISSAVSTCSNASGGSDYWTEETIPMAPAFKWKPGSNGCLLNLRSLTIRQVPGTTGALFLIKYENDFSLSYYDWKKKSLSNSKINTIELSSRLTYKYGRMFNYDDFELYTFIPNLLRVN